MTALSVLPCRVVSRGQTTDLLCSLVWEKKQHVTPDDWLHFFFLLFRTRSKVSVVGLITCDLKTTKENDAKRLPTQRKTEESPEGASWVLSSSNQSESGSPTYNRISAKRRLSYTKPKRPTGSYFINLSNRRRNASHAQYGGTGEDTCSTISQLLDDVVKCEMRAGAVQWSEIKVGVW